MSPETIFRIHLILGYVAWLLCFVVYILPWLKSMDLFAVGTRTAVRWWHRKASAHFEASD